MTAKTANDRRLAAEMSVVRQVIRSALTKGYIISVNDGGEWTVNHSTTFSEIVAALRTTDEDFIYVMDSNRKFIGRVNFVYGNMPYEVISDHTDSVVMDELLIDANKRAERIESKYS